MFESLAICKYLDKRYVHEHSLFGKNAHEQAIITAYVRRIEVHLVMNGLVVMRKHHPKNRLLENPTPELFNEAKASVILILRNFEQRLRQQAYLATSYFSMADVVFYTTWQWCLLRDIFPQGLDDTVYLKRYFQKLQEKTCIKHVHAIGHA